MGGAATMFRGTAAGMREQTAERAESAGESARQAADFASTARLIGTESIDGRQAFLLRADRLNQTQEADGQRFTLQTASVWIDSTDYLMLGMKVDGVATSGTETRPITIERRDSAFRAVPGNGMFESHRQVMRIKGMMDPSQEAEMQQMQQKAAQAQKAQQTKSGFGRLASADDQHDRRTWIDVGLEEGVANFACAAAASD